MRNLHKQLHCVRSRFQSHFTIFLEWSRHPTISFTELSLIWVVRHYPEPSFILSSHQYSACENCYGHATWTESGFFDIWFPTINRENIKYRNSGSKPKPVVNPNFNFQAFISLFTEILLRSPHYFSLSCQFLTKQRLLTIACMIIMKVYVYSRSNSCNWILILPRDSIYLTWLLQLLVQSSEE